MLTLAGCPDQGPALLTCDIAAGVFVILLYYKDVAPVLKRGLTAVITGRVRNVLGLFNTRSQIKDLGQIQSRPKQVFPVKKSTIKFTENICFFINIVSVEV